MDDSYGFSLSRTLTAVGFGVASGVVPKLLILAALQHKH